MKDDLDQLVKLSARINETAKAGDWDTLEQLQAQRSQLLARLSQLSDEALANSSDEVRKAVDQIRTLDTESAACAKENQKKLSDEHQKQSKGQKMKKAYGAF